MSDCADKERLKCLLNAGLELRKKLFACHEATEESRTLGGELLRIAGAARTMAVQLQHAHGQACAMELQLAARVWAMSCLLFFFHSYAHAHIGDDDCDDDANTMNIDEESNTEDEKTVERELEVVQGIAKNYGDVNLVLRLLELKALLYNYTAETWKEVRVDELAVAIGGRTGQRVVSLVGAYWRLIEAANISLVQATVRFNEAEKKRREEALLAGQCETAQREGERLESDEQARLRQVLLEYNLKCWNEIEWLRENNSRTPPAPDTTGTTTTATTTATTTGAVVARVDYEEFLRRYHVPVYGVCVFVGTTLANPYISEWKQRDVAASLRAFATAIRVAELTHDDERLCTAVAFRVRAYYGRAPAAEQEQMVAELRRLQETKQPQGSDVRDLLDDIEKQRASFGAGDTEQAKALQQRLMQQFQQLQQMDQIHK